MATPEAAVKRKVSALLKTYGDKIFYDMPVPAGYGKSTLDYMGCCNGYFFVIETKGPGKKPTDRQSALMEQVVKSGGAVFCIVGVDSQVFPYLKLWLDRVAAR